jgi:hypothetical protein
MLGTRSRAIVFSLLLAGGFGPGTASGEAVPERPVAVQVKPLSIPVAKADQTGNTQFITVYLVVDKKNLVQTACYWMPRIRDALMQTFYNRPLAWDSFAKLHLGAEDARLFRIVRSAMNNNSSITKVHAIAGDRLPSGGTFWSKNTVITKCKEEKAKTDDKKKH